MIDRRQVAALQNVAAQRREESPSAAASSTATSTHADVALRSLEAKLVRCDNLASRTSFNSPLRRSQAAKAEACIALKSHVSFLSSQLARHVDEQRLKTQVRQETARRLRFRAELLDSDAQVTNELRRS